MLYTPTRVTSSVSGPRIRMGALSSRVKMWMSGMFSPSSTTLPMSIETMTPQNSSGWVSMSCGPGVMPWIMSAPKMTAMVVLAGIPRPRSGMNDELAAALFAVSGPATPSMAPRPNRPGVFETRFSTPYEAIDGYRRAPAGQDPEEEADHGTAADLPDARSSERFGRTRP